MTVPWLANVDHAPIGTREVAWRAIPAPQLTRPSTRSHAVAAAAGAAAAGRARGTGRDTSLSTRRTLTSGSTVCS